MKFFNWKWFYFLVALLALVLPPIAVILLIIKGIYSLKSREKNISLKELKEKYNETKAEYENALKEKEKLLKENVTLNLKKKLLHDEIKEIVHSKDSYTAYKKLENELTAYQVGIYEKLYDFDISEEYKVELKKIQEKQKNFIKDKKAIKISHSEYDDAISSLKKSLVNKFNSTIQKLILRAFNNECDVAISKVSYRNFENMRKKINSSFEQINKLGEIFGINIDIEYLKLKIIELQIAYEYQLKLQAEKEEQLAIREQMREEAKVQKEIERMEKEAKKEEELYKKALEKAQRELHKASEEEKAELNSQIEALHQKLHEVEEKMKRAKSMAEQTKRGHVYIISNIGSFGENIYKIGMTRRLTPEDRVNELGDASVPFKFDIHAMIYSENAPALENELHKRFNDKRVNKINNRKEFFNVTLEEISLAVRELHGDFKLTKVAEAFEYRQSLAIQESQVASQAS